MSIETTNAVRQKRPKGFYISDNELVDHFAAGIGIYAFGVYHLLMRRAEDRDGARISQRQIQELLGISTDSARNAIATLKNAGLVEEVPSERPDDAPMYLISYAKDVLAERRAAGKGCPEFGTRVKTKRVRNSGHAASESQDAGARNFGQHRPEFRTPNIEVNQTKLLEQDNTPLPPASGGSVRSVLDAASEDDNRPGEASVANLAVVGGRELAGASEAQWSSAKRVAALLTASLGVLLACGVTEDERLRLVIEDALEAHCKRTGCTLKLAQMLAIENVKAYIQDATLLRFKWGWKKFFREGYWQEARLWPYDKDELKTLRRRL